MNRRHMIRRIPVLAFATLGLALLTGCASDSLLGPGTAPAPVGAGQALLALQDAYEVMDASVYERLLHTDYRFEFREPDKAAFDRDDDLASTRNMFSGTEHRSRDGRLAPGVASIDFQRLEVLDGWSEPAPGEVDWTDAEGVLRADVAYAFVLRLKNGRHMNVRGKQVVYVAPVRAEDWDGSLHRRWQLVGQKDR